MRNSKSLWEYYSVLGLATGASAKEVRNAYIRLVKKWHPDRFAHDPRSQRFAEEKLKQITEAYAALQAANFPSARQAPYRSPNGAAGARSQYSAGGSTASSRQGAASGQSGNRGTQDYTSGSDNRESWTGFSYGTPPQREARFPWWVISILVIGLSNALTGPTGYSDRSTSQPLETPTPVVSVVPLVTDQNSFDPAKTELTPRDTISADSISAQTPPTKSTQQRQATTNGPSVPIPSNKTEARPHASQ